MKVAHLLGSHIENQQAREDAQAAAQQAAFEAQQKDVRENRKVDQGDVKNQIEQRKVELKEEMLEYDRLAKQAQASRDYAGASKAKAEMGILQTKSAAYDAWLNNTATEQQKKIVESDLSHGRAAAAKGPNEAQERLRHNTAAEAAQAALQADNPNQFNIFNKHYLDNAPDDSRTMYRYKHNTIMPNEKLTWELPAGETLGSVRAGAKQLGITVEEALKFIYKQQHGEPL